MSTLIKVSFAKGNEAMKLKVAECEGTCGSTPIATGEVKRAH